MAPSAEPTSAEATVRAFFAIELSPEARNAADDVASELRGRAGGDCIRWVRPENFHVTLRFLGDIARSRVPVVAECVADCIAGSPGGYEPFEMHLGEISAFPSLRRPRVVTLDVAPHAPLEALASTLERGVQQAGLLGLSRDGHPLRSHLTLGRVRRGGRPPSLEAARPTDPAPTPVEEIVLFRSELSHTGARYTRLERIPLVNRT